MFRSSDDHHQGAFWSWLKSLVKISVFKCGYAAAYVHSFCMLSCVERHVDMYILNWNARWNREKLHTHLHLNATLNRRTRGQNFRITSPQMIFWKSKSLRWKTNLTCCLEFNGLKICVNSVNTGWSGLKVTVVPSYTFGRLTVTVVPSYTFGRLTSKECGVTFKNTTTTSFQTLTYSPNTIMFRSNSLHL
jgi:hypothetical protein